MVKVGDRIRLSSMKGPDREGVVTAVTGSLVRVRWPSREETMVTPAPGTLTVLGAARSTTTKATAKKASTKAAAKKTAPKAAAKTTGGAKKSTATKRTTKAAKRPAR